MDHDTKQLNQPINTASNLWIPKTLQEAWQIKQQYGEEAGYISGGTLLQLNREQGTPLPNYLISLESIDHLKGIQPSFINGRESISIGSLTTLGTCLTNPLLAQEASLLIEAISVIAAPAVRNRGTIGGNLVYGIGDSIPALLALDAEVSWYDGQRIEVGNLNDLITTDAFDFSSSILTSIHLPSQPITSKVIRFYKKVGRREAFIPSLVTISGFGWWNANDTIEELRLVVGGGTQKPQRLIGCEQLLIGSHLTENHLEEIAEKIVEEYHPEADPFASASYRIQVAINIVVSELERLVTS
ncbi:FAD binding domain-containing protein [Radiobacillus sp. PE A8.2]|uniref:FAD binding domain-containing protein n=1 Tax=Radiobacillus sp. PE A8.2 TaxID=3380349 RepID=UPI00388D5C8E